MQRTHHQHRHAPLPPPADVKRPQSARQSLLCVPLRTPDGTHRIAATQDDAKGVSSRPPSAPQHHTSRMCQLATTPVRGASVSLAMPSLPPRVASSAPRGAARRDESSTPRSARAAPPHLVRPLERPSRQGSASTPRGTAGPLPPQTPAKHATAPTREYTVAVNRAHTASATVASSDIDESHRATPTQVAFDSDLQPRQSPATGETSPAGTPSASSTAKPGAGDGAESDRQRSKPRPHHPCERLYDPGYRARRQKRIIARYSTNYVLDEYFDDMQKTREAFFRKAPARAASGSRR